MGKLIGRNRNRRGYVRTWEHEITGKCRVSAYDQSKMIEVLDNGSTFWVNLSTFCGTLLTSGPIHDVERKIEYGKVVLEVRVPNMKALARQEAQAELASLVS
jgi:hypothetical protein